MSGKTAKANRRMVLTTITLSFEGQPDVNLDPTKVQIIDRETKQPLFKEALQEQ